MRLLLSWSSVSFVCKRGFIGIYFGFPPTKSGAWGQRLDCRQLLICIVLGSRITILGPARLALENQLWQHILVPLHCPQVLDPEYIPLALVRSPSSIISSAPYANLPDSQADALRPSQAGNHAHPACTAGNCEGQARSLLICSVLSCWKFTTQEPVTMHLVFGWPCPKTKIWSFLNRNGRWAPLLLYG